MKSLKYNKLKLENRRLCQIWTCTGAILFDNISRKRTKNNKLYISCVAPLFQDGALTNLDVKERSTKEWPSFKHVESFHFAVVGIEVGIFV